MRPLRVLYFVANYHRFTGSQKSLLLLVTGFSRKDVDPVVVFPGDGACSAAYRAAGVDVRILEAPAALHEFGGGLLRSGWRQRVRLAFGAVLPYTARVARLIRDERADLVHLNNARSAMLAGPGAVAARVPRVYHVRSDERSLGVFSQLSSGMSNRVILVADALHSSVPARWRERCRVVHNGIRPPNDVPSRSRAELLEHLFSGSTADDTFLAVVVGTVTPFKGAHHAISALAALHTVSPSLAARTRLVFVGDVTEPAYGELLRARIPHALRANVGFAGWDDRPLDWIRASDAVLLPTVDRERLVIDGHERAVFGTEGFSRTVLEAMACGRPVIATRVAGVPEQVDDGVTGHLVPPSDPRALGDALRALIELDEPARRKMGQAGLARSSRFSIDAMCEKTLAVYREIT